MQLSRTGGNTLEIYSLGFQLLIFLQHQDPLGVSWLLAQQTWAYL